MRLATLVILTVLAGGVNAYGAPVSGLIKDYQRLDTLCRTDGTAADCERRESVRENLQSDGYCLGKIGQSRNEMVWHGCTANSLH